MGATSYLDNFESATDPTLNQVYDSASAMANGPIWTPLELSVTEPTPETTKEKTATSSSIDNVPLIDSQMILHPADVPVITSSFNLSPSVGAELLRVIEQLRTRLEKELKESQKLAK